MSHTLAEIRGSTSLLARPSLEYYGGGETFLGSSSFYSRTFSERERQSWGFLGTSRDAFTEMNLKN